MDHRLRDRRPWSEPSAGLPRRRLHGTGGAGAEPASNPPPRPNGVLPSGSRCHTEFGRIGAARGCVRMICGVTDNTSRSSPGPNWEPTAVHDRNLAQAGIPAALRVSESGSGRQDLRLAVFQPQESVGVAGTDGVGGSCLAESLWCWLWS